jgi:hypothetical protein
MRIEVDRDRKSIRFRHRVADHNDAVETPFASDGSVGAAANDGGVLIVRTLNFMRIAEPHDAPASRPLKFDPARAAIQW